MYTSTQSIFNEMQSHWNEEGDPRKDNLGMDPICLFVAQRGAESP